MNRTRRRKAPWEIKTDLVLKAVRETLEAGIRPENDSEQLLSTSVWEQWTSEDTLTNTANKDTANVLRDIDYPTENSVDLIPYDDYDARKLLPSEQLHRDSQQTPSSCKDFMTRLSTYDILYWSRKPDCISSFHCARYGWQLCKNLSALVCVTCKKLIPTFKDCIYGMSSNDYNQQLRKGVEESCHASSCPWRKYYTPVTILCLPKGFDMFHFVRDGVASLSQIISSPCLKSHYSNIMENLDLKWMQKLTGVTFNCNENLNGSDDDTSSVLKLNQMTHFLVLNGWSMMDSTIDDGISCKLCLRQVPLWFCKNPPADCEILDLTSPLQSSSRCVESKFKEFDPVNNHWWWCPWRRFLEFSEASDLFELLVPEAESSIFERRFEDSAYLKNKAECEDYLRLKALIEAECLEASSISRDKVMGPQLIVSVGSIMDEFISSNPVWQALERSKDSSLMLPAGGHLSSNTNSGVSVQVRTSRNGLCNSSKNGTQMKADSEDCDPGSVSTVDGVSSQTNIAVFSQDIPTEKHPSCSVSVDDAVIA